MMTEKHFIEIANIIKYNRPGRDTEAIDSAACDLADMFQRENSLFDRTKFIVACGLRD